MMQKQQADLPSTDEGFSRCRVDCPICGCETVQYRLNPRLYWNTSLDLDRKPADYQCLHAIEGIYPPLYDLWHCPACHFTAHNRIFPDPLKHVFIDKSIVRKTLMDAGRGDAQFRHVCDTLGADTPADRRTFDDAIRLALLGIYYRLAMLAVLRQGHAALARDYLRLAWLWRDRPRISPDAPVDEQRLEAAATAWPEMPRDEDAALSAACEAFAVALEEGAVAEDIQETLSILQHIGRIQLQMQDMVAAGDWLRRALQLAVEEQQRLDQALRAPEPPGARSDLPDRASLITIKRRTSGFIDDCRELLDRCGKTRGQSVSSSAESASGRPRRKGWFSRS